MKYASDYVIAIYTIVWNLCKYIIKKYTSGTWDLFGPVYSESGKLNAWVISKYVFFYVESCARVVVLTWRFMWRPLLLWVLYEVVHSSIWLLCMNPSPIWPRGLSGIYAWFFWHWGSCENMLVLMQRLIHKPTLIMLMIIITCRFQDSQALLW